MITPQSTGQLLLAEAWLLRISFRFLSPPSVLDSDIFRQSVCETEWSTLHKMDNTPLSEREKGRQISLSYVRMSWKARADKNTEIEFVLCCYAVFLETLARIIAF